MRLWVEELNTSAMRVRGSSPHGGQRTEPSDGARERLLLRGTVQGVGFRPFVWRLANSLSLAGFVRNLSCGVEIEIQGRRDHLDEFRRRLLCEAPAAATIESIEIESREVCPGSDFRAVPSEHGRQATSIPSDLAVCAECVSEIFDPDSRRYRYPFTNCTACGPRFTVFKAPV